ncbi:poly-gamma-glutamate synthase PgsB [Saccharothrix sp. 6-C]|uniref:poly-gamma-glutamate synthase PgsB n=1 Tax=Saccharothrix sp. 6-C TaxID=2781735 RepID=UPI0019175074|nr:poly-gamma-glutamate synthase PgsB [Saccharothrix sp. 6-C]QQQ74161.1 poly-gamma-glutamate synthase PgsB [Saccharothrix sp. 6-C]
MTYLYVVFVLLTVGTFAAGVVEQRRHLGQLGGIEHRVLVNGIRGKSSITRLCAGALRGGGLVTTAKTTGTAARFIHPDGSEEPVYRKWGIANVVEQIGIVRRAAAYRSDALVIECMAVMPDLQEINQSKLIRSTIGVLCNVREDHLAEMGPTLDDVARSLSRSMPVGGVCVTAEVDRLHILEAEAAKRDCELIAVDPESVTDEDMAGFTWITFKENVAIALKVADLLGVNRRSALAGMWSAPPDPGVLSVHTRIAGDKRIKLANVFAANDPESTLMNIERLLEQGSIGRPLHVVINCRPDRVERNQQMGALVARIDPDRVVLIGEPTRSALAAVDERWRDRVTDLGGARNGQEILDAVLAGVESTASLVAIGNIHGQGEMFLEAVEHLEEPPPSEQAAPAEVPVGKAARVEPGTRVEPPARPAARPAPAGDVPSGRTPRPTPPRGAAPGPDAGGRPRPLPPRRTDDGRFPSPLPDARHEPPRAPGERLPVHTRPHEHRRHPAGPGRSAETSRDASPETRFVNPVAPPSRGRLPVGDPHRVQEPRRPAPDRVHPEPVRQRYDPGTERFRAEHPGGVTPRPAHRTQADGAARGDLFDSPGHGTPDQDASPHPDHRTTPRPRKQS